MTGDEVTVAYEAPSLTEADLVVGLLRANGIPAFLDNEASTVTLDGYVGLQRIVKVLVPAGTEDMARRLIVEAGRLGPAEEEE